MINARSENTAGTAVILASRRQTTVSDCTQGSITDFAELLVESSVACISYTLDKSVRLKQLTTDHVIPKFGVTKAE